MEEAIRSMPRAAQTGSESAFADTLLNYGYHRNPYVRTFTSVLWSGYALSRGQVVDSDARFRKAHTDATVSNVDRTTIAALESAHTALQESLSPAGSVTTFLDELRERTIQRMWSRVCETSMLPPPSFSKLLNTPQADAPSEEELEAAEMAEIAALMKSPEDLFAVSEADAEAVEDDSQRQAEAATGNGDADTADDAYSGETDADTAEETELQLSVTRKGNSEMGPELVLQASAEILKQLRVQGATGNLEVTISVVGVGRGRRPSGRRRRGRRRG